MQRLPELAASSSVNESFESARAAEPVGAFPHAKRVGNLLFLSGIGPRVRGSKEIPGVTLDAERNIVSYEIERQCHAVFENVRLVLEDAGATWNDIVDVTVFLTNMKKDFAIFNRIYPEYFAGPGKPNPTRTTVEVGALPTPIAIELKVIAACRGGLTRPAAPRPPAIGARRALPHWVSRVIANVASEGVARLPGALSAATRAPRQDCSSKRSSSREPLRAARRPSHPQKLRTRQRHSPLRARATPESCSDAFRSRNRR